MAAPTPANEVASSSPADEARRWRRTNDGLIEWFITRPDFGAVQARLLILFFIGAIAFVDYASGIRVSLAVFYLIPIALTVSWFGWKEAVGAVVLSMGLRILGDYASIDEPTLPLWSVWNSLAALLILLIVVWIFDALLSLRRQLEARIAERTARLVEAATVRERLEQELLQIGARERNAFGQALHDDICQHLVGTALAAKVHTRNLAAQGSALASEAQAIVTWLEEGAHKTRQLARGLLLSEMDPETLGDQIEQLIEDADKGGVACRYRQEGRVLTPDAVAAGQMFRIAQEALRNALGHAGATHVDISLVGDADAICLMIEDDGRGLSTADRSNPGMGLQIMSHRADTIGGKLSIVSSSDNGTRVIVHLPRKALDAP